MWRTSGRRPPCRCYPRMDLTYCHPRSGRSRNPKDSMRTATQWISGSLRRRNRKMSESHPDTNHLHQTPLKSFDFSQFCNFLYTEKLFRDSLQETDPLYWTKSPPSLVTMFFTHDHLVGYHHGDMHFRQCSILTSYRCR
mgnify:CR=1 FL=1